MLSGVFFGSGLVREPSAVVKRMVGCVIAVVAVRVESSEDRAWRTTSRMWAAGIEATDAPNGYNHEPGVKT